MPTSYSRTHPQSVEAHLHSVSLPTLTTFAHTPQLRWKSVHSSESSNLRRAPHAVYRPPPVHAVLAAIVSDDEVGRFRGEEWRGNRYAEAITGKVTTSAPSINITTASTATIANHYIYRCDPALDVVTRSESATTIPTALFYTRAGYHDVVEKVSMRDEGSINVASNHVALDVTVGLGIEGIIDYRATQGGGRSSPGLMVQGEEVSEAEDEHCEETNDHVEDDGSEYYDKVCRKRPISTIQIPTFRPHSMSDEISRASPALSEASTNSSIRRQRDLSDSPATAAIVTAARKRRSPDAKAKFVWLVLRFSLFILRGAPWLSARMNPSELCGESFTRLYNLKGELCRGFQFSFRSECTLTFRVGHERSHRNEKPFACNFGYGCDKAFARPHELVVRHLFDCWTRHSV